MESVLLLSLQKIVGAASMNMSESCTPDIVTFCGTFLELRNFRDTFGRLLKGDKLGENLGLSRDVCSGRTCRHRMTYMTCSYRYVLHTVCILAHLPR